MIMNRLKRHTDMKQFKLLLTIVCIVLCYGCPPPPPVEYQYTELSPDGWQDVYSVIGINNKGEVVGNGQRF